MTQEQQQRTDQVGARGKQESAPVPVAVRSTGNFREYIDDPPLSSFPAGRQRFREQQIFQEHSKQEVTL